MQDKKKFLEMMTGFCEIHGKELSENALKLYIKAVENFDDELVFDAMNRFMLGSSFFPKPHDIIELIQGKTSDAPLLAWQSVIEAIAEHGAYQSVRFEDGRIGRAIALMGGWPALCSTDTKDMVWRQKDFERIYTSLHPESSSESLQGLHESSNLKKGYFKQIGAPAFIPMRKQIAGQGARLLTCVK